MILFFYQNHCVFNYCSVQCSFIMWIYLSKISLLNLEIGLWSILVYCTLRRVLHSKAVIEMELARFWNNKPFMEQQTILVQKKKQKSPYLIEQKCIENDINFLFNNSNNNKMFIYILSCIVHLSLYIFMFVVTENNC